MIEFKALNKPKIAILLDNQVEVTFTTTKAALKGLETLKDKELSVTVKTYSQRRSLSQNAYMWVLLDKIANAVNRAKEDVYKEYIKDYGLFEILPLKNEAVETFINKWGKNGVGWFCRELGKSKIEGYTNIVAYYGSSTYKSDEMQRVVNAIVDDCKELNIDTMTYAEIMRLSNEND